MEDNVGEERETKNGVVPLSLLEVEAAMKPIKIGKAGIQMWLQCPNCKYSSE